MSAFVFFIAAIGVVAGAIGVVAFSNPFYSVLSLVGHLLSLAVLFLLLRAEFVAAIQVVLYAGAVMVLYVFVVAYVGGEEQSLRSSPTRRVRSRGQGGRKPSGMLFAAALLVELLIALLGSGLKAVEGYGAGYQPGPEAFGTPGWIGDLLLTRFLLVFEISSLLLLVATVGGVVLARRRRGLADEYTPLQTRRPLGTGTMLEAVEGLGLAFARAGGREAGEDDGASAPAAAEPAAAPAARDGGGW